MWHRKNQTKLIEAQHQAQQKSPWLMLVYQAKSRARQAMLSYDLTTAWAEQRWTGRCELTSIPFAVREKPRVYSPSVDRIDPKKGYTQDNCRFVLWAVNALKGEGTDADVFRIAEAIIRTRRP